MNKFCVAMFNAIRKDNNQNIRPCCIFDSEKTLGSILEYKNSEYIKDIKNRMLNNEQVPECNICWEKENNQIPSLRHIYNQQFLRTNEVPDKLVKKVFHSNKIIHADIKIGNTCNFACAMCHPGDSSLIYNKFRKNPTNEFVKEYTSKPNTYMDEGANTRFRNQSLNMLDEILAMGSLKSLKLLGGEPLLEPKFLQKLKDIPSIKKEKIVLYLVTNGSVDLVEVLTGLGKFKKIFITISLEGIKKTQEYVRKNSNWSQIEINIKKFLSTKNPDWHLGIHHTIQAMSLHGLPDLVNWCNNYKLNLSVQTLTTPEYLSIAVLDNEYRNKCIDTLETNIINNPVNLDFGNDDDFIKLSDIKNYCSSIAYNPDLKDKFLRYVDFYEIDHTIKLLDITPNLLEKLHE